MYFKELRQPHPLANMLASGLPAWNGLPEFAWNGRDLLEIAEDCFTLPHFARNGQTLHGPHCISGCVASWQRGAWNS